MLIFNTNGNGIYKNIHLAIKIRSLWLEKGLENLKYDTRGR